MASSGFDYGEAIRNFTCDELKKLLAKADLPKSGLKTDLQRRCLEYLNVYKDPVFLCEITALQEAKSMIKRTSGIRRTSSIMSIDKCMARMSIMNVPPNFLAQNQSENQSVNQSVIEVPKKQQVDQESQTDVYKPEPTSEPTSESISKPAISKVSVHTQTDLARATPSVETSQKSNGNEMSTIGLLYSDLNEYKFEPLPFHENISELARCVIFAPSVKGFVSACVLKLRDASLQSHLRIKNYDAIGIQIRLAVLYRNGKLVETIPSSLTDINAIGLSQVFVRNNISLRDKAIKLPVEMKDVARCKVELTFSCNNTDELGYVASMILCSNPPVPIREIALPIVISSLTRLSIAESRQLIVEKFKRTISDDCDIDVDSNSKMKISLLCPLSGTRCIVPVRGFKCSHLQVFNAADYIKLNHAKPKWQCPICLTETPYDCLLVDQYLERILSETTSNEIELLSDGSWQQVKRMESRVALETIIDSPVQVARDVVGRKIDF